VGSGFYRSPQICNHKPFDGEKADVFALANVLFIMKFLKFPVESIRINGKDIANPYITQSS